MKSSKIVCSVRIIFPFLQLSQPIHKYRLACEPNSNSNSISRMKLVARTALRFQYKYELLPLRKSFITFAKSCQPISTQINNIYRLVFPYRVASSSEGFNSFFFFSAFYSFLLLSIYFLRSNFRSSRLQQYC